MKKTTSLSVMVVGGYGEVGRHAVRVLSLLGFSVTIAGRNSARAKDFINSLKDTTTVSFRFLDLEDSAIEYSSLLDDVSVVLMCADQADIAFARACFENGIYYVDITADDTFFRKIEDLSFIATQRKALGVLSVGLAPGMTNLLAKECAGQGSTHELEIGLILGTGDSHGKQALRWTVKNLLRWKPDIAPRSINFGRTWGRRLSYAFEFSDQYILERTLGIRTNTFLCFSSSFLTFVMFLFRKFPLLSFAQNNLKLIEHIASIPWGRNKRYTAMVRSVIDGKTKNQISLNGEGEAQITGVVAAIVIDSILRKHYGYGVFHIHEIFDLTDVIDQIQKYSGCTVDR